MPAHGPVSIVGHIAAQALPFLSFLAASRMINMIEVSMKHSNAQKRNSQPCTWAIARTCTSCITFAATKEQQQTNSICFFHLYDVKMPSTSQRTDICCEMESSCYRTRRTPTRARPQHLGHASTGTSHPAQIKTHIFKQTKMI